MTSFSVPLDGKVRQLLGATRMQADKAYVMLVSAPSHKRKKALQILLKQTGAVCHMMEQVETWTFDDETLTRMMLEWVEDVQRAIDLYNFGETLSAWPPVIEAWRRANRFFENRQEVKQPQDLTTLFL